MRLLIEVSDEDGDAILEWAMKPHRVFVTSSVPALHMWEVGYIREAGDSE